MLHALNKNIIVKPTEPVSKTPGGIVLVESAQDKPTTGIIVDMGDNTGWGRTPKRLSVGDTIIFSKYTGVSHEDVLIVHEDNVLAVVS